MMLLDLEDGGVRQVVVVAVADDDGVDDGDVFEVAGLRGEAFRTHECEWRAAVFKDGIEQDTQTRGEFDVVARMAQPRRAEFVRSITRRKPLRRNDGYSGRFRVGPLEVAGDGWPEDGRPHVCDAGRVGP